MLTAIRQQTHTQQQPNPTLGRTEDRLRKLNAQLEQRVVKRTAALETANQDLQGFSYSVSHDLRAPIRAITGFCALLEADHGSQLDTEAKRKLTIVKSEADRMGRLIDDLLAFSRLGRKSLQPTELDMAALAGTVWERIEREETSKKFEMRLGSLPAAHGDQRLLEQVWTNLLSNAVKFSSKSENPIIEVGGIADTDEYVYFVRDNGAGFDPKYADRLFGVFQRLHDEGEFPGTGVGLALVHKIVTRHGGRVWGDGKPGDGATFYFTLPKEQADGPV
jgi:light-regulated signal transduction histidine kinase (bacteriophytochrome)